MSAGIHDTILNFVQKALEKAMITDITDPADKAKAGIVKLGPLQGDPDPDEARISVELYENDPDQTVRNSGIGMSSENWEDTIYEVEVGGVITWERRFTVKARCLFVNTQEALAPARSIASTVRTRIERTLLATKFAGLATDDKAEYVSRGILSEDIDATTLQAGGPDAYDFHIKVRFTVLTTQIRSIENG